MGVKVHLLKPAPAVLIAVASAAVHAEEFLSAGGDPIDKEAFTASMNAPGVREWIDAMTKAAFLPLKRQTHEAATSRAYRLSGKAK